MRKSYVRDMVTKKTSIILAVYQPRKGLTFFVDICPEELSKSLFFESWLVPGPGMTARSGHGRWGVENRGETP
jgi:hypothetical protein